MESLSLVALLAGLAGTTAMLVFLNLMAYGGAVESRLPLALGALVLKRMEGAKGVGYLLHYTFGIIFGYIYTYLIVLGAQPRSDEAVVFMSLTFGLIHGIFATFVMIGTAERHPLKKFRESPVASSLAHALAHLVFGLVVGLTIVGLGYKPL